MGFIRFVLGLLGGAIVGAIGCVVYAGPLDLPIVGLILATAIVASGAWFVLEWGRASAWGGYTVAVAAMTFFLLMRDQNTDALVVPDMWPAEVWLILAPFAAIVAGLVAARRRR